MKAKRRMYRRFIAATKDGRWCGYQGTGPFLWNLEREAWEACEAPDDTVVAVDVTVELAKPKARKP